MNNSYKNTKITWGYQDIPGLVLNIVVSKLAVCEGVKPIKQLQWHFRSALTIQ